jgi:hypothetical protein
MDEGLGCRPALVVAEPPVTVFAEHVGEGLGPGDVVASPGAGEGFGGSPCGIGFSELVSGAGGFDFERHFAVIAAHPCLAAGCTTNVYQDG